MDLYKYFSQFDWTIIKEPNLPLNIYQEDLSKYSFVLCPWGNGYDTNRLWEALYSGCIVVTKKHHTFSNLKGLPILLVDSYEDINMELLIAFKEQIERNGANYEKLNVLWWINYMNDIKNYDNQTYIEIKQNHLFSNFYKFKWKKKFQIESKYKKFNFFFLRLKKYLIRIVKNG